MRGCAALLATSGLTPLDLAWWSPSLSPMTDNVAPETPRERRQVEEALLCALAMDGGGRARSCSKTSYLESRSMVQSALACSSPYGHPLRMATLWAREETPRRVDAGERLRRRSAVRPKSPISTTSGHPGRCILTSGTPHSTGTRPLRRCLSAAPARRWARCTPRLARARAPRVPPRASRAPARLPRLPCLAPPRAPLAPPAPPRAPPPARATTGRSRPPLRCRARPRAAPWQLAALLPLTKRYCTDLCKSTRHSSNAPCEYKECGRCLFAHNPSELRRDPLAFFQKHRFLYAAQPCRLGVGHGSCHGASTSPHTHATTRQLSFRLPSPGPPRAPLTSPPPPAAWARRHF